jgi:hypothetical protein
MTSQTNAQVVAQLYWTLRAIKEATGVTTRCWRPPYGDVDDRVRAIAWQMGMTTYLWDQDTNDWDMPGDGGGNLAPSKVDGYFQGWIDTRKKGTDKHGHIVLEHELNNATVKMTEKWLPKLQESFNVVSIQQCMNISQPYWEENWVYPTEENPQIANTSSTTTAATSPSAVASTIPASISATTTTAQQVSSTPAAAESPEASSSSSTSNNVLANTNAQDQSGAVKTTATSASVLAAAAIAAYFI